MFSFLEAAPALKLFFCFLVAYRVERARVRQEDAATKGRQPTPNGKTTGILPQPPQSPQPPYAARHTRGTSLYRPAYLDGLHRLRLTLGIPLIDQFMDSRDSLVEPFLMLLGECMKTDQLLLRKLR